LALERVLPLLNDQLDILRVLVELQEQGEGVLVLKQSDPFR
jgi:hypothetical protein